MPPSFPDLVRDEVVLDQSLSDQLGLSRPQTSVDLPALPYLIVARKVVLAGATIVDMPVTILADEVVDSPTLGGAPGLIVQFGREATLNTTGRAGFGVTILTNTLGAVTVESHGQRGGEGLQGDRAGDLDCTPPPGGRGGAAGALPVDDDPQIPPEPIKGLTGHPGKIGARGGPGGTVLVRSVFPAPAGTARRLRGVGGAGGRGGRGGDGGEGCPSKNFGDRGPRGTETLGPGADVAGSATSISGQDLTAQISDQVIAFMWGEVRMEAADVATRRGEHQVARGELARADALEAPAASAAALRRRLHHFLTPLGVERDFDVVPAVDTHGATWDAARSSYLGAVAPNGANALLSLGRPELVAARGPLQEAHKELINASQKLMDDDRTQRVTALANARSELAGLFTGVVDSRIPTLIDTLGASPLITLAPGVQADARVFAERILTFLGDRHGAASDDRSLLAADLDLLCRGTENAAYATPGSGELGQIRFRARGLRGITLTEPPPTTPNPIPQSWDNPRTVVSFAAVMSDLRAAQGDPRLLLELRELVELSHRSRMLQLREIQNTEGVAQQQHFFDQARVTQTSLAQPADVAVGNTTTSRSTETLAVEHLHGARDFADVFAWAVRKAERALSLYTVDAVAPVSAAPGSAASPSAAAAAELHSPDRREELRQHTGAPGPLLHAALLNAVHHDPRTALASYKQRGSLFIEGPGNSSVEPLTFDSKERPEVLTRLKLSGNVWFDAGVDDLSPGRFEGKVVGVGVVLEGVDTVPNPTGTIDELTMLVEHSGISRQRRLDKSVVAQYLLPGAVQVQLHRGKNLDGSFTNNWSGSMRYDDTNGEGAGQPGDFPLWGRGAATGWRVSFADFGTVVTDQLERFELEVEYDSFPGPDHQTSLLRIDQPLDALVPGRTVMARAVLTGPAPAGGLRVALGSDEPTTLSVPAAVVVPAGADTVGIPVTVHQPSAGLVRLRATSPDGFSRRAVVHVPAPAPGQAAAVTRLDVRAPGADLTMVSGLAFHGDRLLGAAGEVRFDEGGSLRPVGPGTLLSVTTTDGATPMSGLRRLPVVDQPRAIAVGNGRAYVLNSDPGVQSLSILDLATDAVLAEVRTGLGPISVAVDAAANLVYVSNWTAKSVDVHQGDTGVRLERVQGVRGPQGLAVDEQRRRVYVAANYYSGGADDIENGLAVISRSATGQHSLDRILPIAGRSLPIDVAFDSQRDLVHVANQGVAGEHQPGITTFLARNLRLLGFTAVPGPLVCCDVHLASGAVACAGPASGVHVVDGEHRRHVSSQPVAHTVQSICYHQPTGAIYAGERQRGEIIRLAAVGVAPVPWR